MPDMEYYWENENHGCRLEKELCCTKDELYLKKPLIIGHTPYVNFGQLEAWPFTGNYVIVSPISGRIALWIDNDGTYDFISGNTHDIDYGGEIGQVSVSVSFEYMDESYVPPMGVQMYGCVSGSGHAESSTGVISTNIPVFETQAEADNYVLYGTGIDDALNYEGEEITEDETEVYYMYNIFGATQIKNGEYKNISPQYYYYNNIRVQANRRPVLYFTDRFQMRAMYADVISWYGNNTAVNIEDVDVSDFNNPPVSGHNTFYADMAKYINTKGVIPKDGSYNYGFKCFTNFAIFRSKADAEWAIINNDYEQEVKYPKDPSVIKDPTVGDPEPETIFGPGSFVSPFIQTYVASETAIEEIADAFYTNNTALLDNIKKGLELFGASPYEAIVGLSAFPFDVTDIVNGISTQNIWFGSYNHTLSNSVLKVTSLEADYIDAGTTTIYEIPGLPMWRQFEPYTSFHVYLPYVGWEKLNIENYLNKAVNVRYYVDIFTRSAVCVLVANGVMQDYFPCTGIGVELPVTGQNLSRYANDTLNGLLSCGKGIVAGALGGSVIPGLGTITGAVGGGILGATTAGAAGVFNMAQKGKPKDQNLTKGSFSAACGGFMPQYVSFRWDVHDIIEPTNLNAIYGQPSSYSGRLSGINGFVKAETIKMNTSGMSDSEVAEVENLISNGIYV